MKEPALFRVEDCSYEHSDGLLEIGSREPVRPGDIRIRSRNLTSALLDAIRRSSCAERRQLVLSDEDLAGEPWYEALGEVRGIHLLASTGSDCSTYRLYNDGEGSPKIAVPEGCEIIRADRLEYRLDIRDADGTTREVRCPTTHHFGFSSQSDSVESDNVVLALAPDEDTDAEHLGSRACETCYNPDDDEAAEIGDAYREECFRDELKRRCRKALCTPEEALRRLAREAGIRLLQNGVPPGGALTLRIMRSHDYTGHTVDVTVDDPGDPDAETGMPVVLC